MAQTNVSSCVLSIIASFSSGLDVFKTLRGKRKRGKRSKTLAQLDQEEVRLVRSLRRGPEEIEREYLVRSQGVGDRFAVGDAAAQSSLAEILLRMNVGLVGIIASFLKGDKWDVQIDLRSLTSLSERSRVETCHTLRRLFDRLARLRVSSARARLNGRVRPEQERNAEKPRHRHEAQSAHTKVPGPILARVVIANSSKPSQIAMVKPGERRSRSSKSKSRSNSASESVASLPDTPPPPYTCPPEQTRSQARPVTRRAQTAPERALNNRSKKVTTDLKGNYPSRELEPDHGQPYRQSERPPTGPQQPLQPQPTFSSLATPTLPRRRKPTPTFYSLASHTTTLGEIPLDKWPEPFDFDAMSLMNREAEVYGWPGNHQVAAVAGLGPGPGQKKRRGLMRLFGRKESASAV
ncbi:hypothetical protein LTR62_003413 [Meristemomyces frigidus]|uniref:Uncharacterized protein n=1 Tax=Meristemomyces frigidus TaxID=1508187 RepID=A0AAN7TIU3_9PEZI|nr:hypothetical protein LTR62_003413 [Meristemomyces frigidus]